MLQRVKGVRYSYLPAWSTYRFKQGATWPGMDGFFSMFDTMLGQVGQGFDENLTRGCTNMKALGWFAEHEGQPVWIHSVEWNVFGCAHDVAMVHAFGSMVLRVPAQHEKWPDYLKDVGLGPLSAVGHRTFPAPIEVGPGTEWTVVLCIGAPSSCAIVFEEDCLVRVCLNAAASDMLSVISP